MGGAKEHHEDTLTPAHLHSYTPSHLHTFTYSHPHACTHLCWILSPVLEVREQMCRGESRAS